MSGRFDMVNTNRFRLACEQGSDFSRVFTFKDSFGAKYDLSAYTSASMQVRAGSGGATYERGNWTPRTISVDAMFSAQGLAGTAGGSVLSWPDSSDRKQDLTTLGAGMLISTSALTGYPVVSHTAGSQFASAMKIDGPFTVAWLRKIVTRGVKWLTIETETGNGFRAVLNANGKGREWGIGNRIAKMQWATTDADSGFHLDVVSYTDDFSALTRTDGTAYTPTLIDPGTSGANATLLGSSGAGDSAHTAELVFFNRALTADELMVLEGYLMHKWGLAAQLPTTHTFKSVAPTGLVEVAPILAASTSDYLAISVANGTVTAEIPFSVTQALPLGTYYYDLVLTGSANQTRVLEGKFEITPRTTF